MGTCQFTVAFLFSKSLSSHSIYNRPANFKELYNLRHASARNVVERVFGVMKHRWTILTHAPHYDMVVQAKIPSALVALHNFILEHDEGDLDRWILDEQAQDNLPGARQDKEIDFGQLAASAQVSSAEKRQAETGQYSPGNVEGLSGLSSETDGCRQLLQ